MGEERLDFALQTAIAYGNMTSTVFNMFLTVLFSSLAFAAAIPLKDIGRPIKIFRWHISGSSFWFSIALFSFYLISFMTFRHHSNKSEQALILIRDTLKNGSQSLISLFEPSSKPLDFIGIHYGWPSLGFIIGASFGIVIFLWVANAERRTK